MWGPSFCQFSPITQWDPNALTHSCVYLSSVGWTAPLQPSHWGLLKTFQSLKLGLCLCCLWKVHNAWFLRVGQADHLTWGHREWLGPLRKNGHFGLDAYLGPSAGLLATALSHLPAMLPSPPLFRHLNSVPPSLQGSLRWVVANSGLWV